VNSSITTSENTFRARRFVWIILGVVGVTLCGITGLNLLVDPYNLYGLNRLGVYISAARENKSTQIKRFPHNALVVGNSHMAFIPVDKLRDFHFFNGAFAGATDEEVYYFLRHHAQKEDLVILGVDLGQMDPPAPAGDEFKPASFADVTDNLLSVKTLEYSFRTIIDHLDGQIPSFAPDGSAEMETWFRLYDHENPNYKKWQMDELRQEYLGSTNSVGGPLLYYQKIAALLRERHIPCVVCVPPLHETLAAEIKASPAALAGFQAWQMKLKAIFPNVVDLAFSPYGKAENYFKSDSGHFKPDTGVLLLNVEVIPVAERVLAAERQQSPTTPASNQGEAKKPTEAPTALPAK
jgi:hypothetical protein